MRSMSRLPALDLPEAGTSYFTYERAGDGWAEAVLALTTAHNAAPSALGYQHQTWWALLELLRLGDTRPDAAISLELFDDVAWEENGTPTQLLQIKHHLKGQRTLTDASVDLWSTLKVWMDTAAPADPEGPQLFLITTQTAADGSAAAALRSDTRDEVFALDALAMAALNFDSDRTGQARRDFLALGPADQQAFISRIFVLDDSPHIDQVPKLVRSELHWALPRGHEDDYLALVWRWWDEQALAMLQGGQRSVDIGAAHAAIAGIRDKFTRALLPTTVDLDHVDSDAVAAAHGDQAFVKQMSWVAYPPRNLQSAIVDYYRAHTQTTHWLDHAYLARDELVRFQRELLDAWECEFEWMEQEIGAQADEATKRQAGVRLLRQLMGRPGPFLSRRYCDAYFGRGQHHILADEGRMGWHADFQEKYGRLQAQP
ncbi:ABC-three component system protein [Streptomyces sp. NPDC050149]|uniref:ABC-three component system protein n=1 Tax=Streptomyces sp. NPDC050149 TaxID=3365603 RepID=UPI0037B9FA13